MIDAALSDDTAAFKVLVGKLAGKLAARERALNQVPTALAA